MSLPSQFERLKRSAGSPRAVTNGGRATSEGDRHLGMVFGLLGSLLILLEGVLRAIGGTIFLFVGHGRSAFATWEQALVLVAIGLITGFFSLYGRSGVRDRGLAAGVALIVLAVIGWFALGFGSELLALLGAVLVLIGGILFLVSNR